MNSDVLIIGAGPAGLACASELARERVGAVVVEQGDAVGSAWRARYDRLRLNTSRWFSQLPGRRYPRGTPVFPSRDEVVAYLEGYVAERSLDVKTATRVERIDREGPGWVARTPVGDLHARHVVVATGLFRSPVMPEWPGRARFRGALLHSSAYRSARPFVGRAVLVVGCGSSGLEIAYDLAEAPAGRVSVAVRTPPNIVLRSVAGAAADPAALLLLHLPPELADRLLSLMHQRLLGDSSDCGLPAPAEGPFQRLRRDGTGPAIVDREVVDAVCAGRIRVVPELREFEEDGVLLEGGSRIDVDAVIAATGYRPGLEPRVGHLDVLGRDGAPRFRSGEEAAPGLHFIGFRAVPALIRDAARQARHIARGISRTSGRRRRHPN